MSIPEKTIAAPTTHYGKARPATWNFIVQRASGALNIVFTAFFIWLLVRLAHADAQGMGDLLSNPVVAVVTGLMIISVALHMRIGMMEVIEDYVGEGPANKFWLTLNWVVTIVIAVATLAALAKLVFWG